MPSFEEFVVANSKQSLGAFDPRGFSPKNTTGHVTQGHLLGYYETNARSQYKSQQPNCHIQRDATPPLAEPPSTGRKEVEDELSSEKEGSYWWLTLDESKRLWQVNENNATLSNISSHLVVNLSSQNYTIVPSRPFLGCRRWDWDTRDIQITLLHQELNPPSHLVIHMYRWAIPIAWYLD